MPRRGKHEGMRCPKCKFGRMIPQKRTPEDDLYWIRRTRICRSCKHKKTTTERFDDPDPPFDDSDIPPQDSNPPENISDGESIDRPIAADTSGDLPGQRYLFKQ